ncbi:MAG: hypothetical protein ACOYLG_01125 [Chitinophagaceae bacterium]
MVNSSEIAKGSGFQAIQNLLNVLREGGDRDTKAIILLLFHIAIFAAMIIPDGIHVLLRKGIGKAKTNLFSIALASISFVVFGYYLFFNDSLGIGLIGQTTNSNKIIGSLFIALGVINFYRGTEARKLLKQNNINSDALGESLWFASFSNINANPLKLILLYEPLYIALLGVMLCLYNFYGGIALLICAASIWIHYLVLYITASFSSNTSPVNKKGTVSR